VQSRAYRVINHLAHAVTGSALRHAKIISARDTCQGTAMPPGVEHIWGPVAMAVLLLFAIYRRFRRFIGRQPLNPKRMVARIVILSVIGALLLPAALHSTAVALDIGAGLLLGVALGLWGAKHTRFEWHEGKLHYVPHTYAGLVVFALFLGRLLYRLLFVWQSGGFVPGAQAPGAPFGNLSQNPLTLSVFFVLIGYYVCYYGFVLREFKEGRHAEIAPEGSMNSGPAEGNKPDASAP
jgi:hypothetical protein